MSKLILSEPRVIDIVVGKFMGKCFRCNLPFVTIYFDAVDENTQDLYVTRPTEWLNMTRSDVVYTPRNRSDNHLPPFLIEIQHTVSLAFYRRLNGYCLEIDKTLPVLPIVIVFGIHSTTADILDMASPSEKFPFVLELPCAGWAKAVYLLNVGTIRPHLHTHPLDPLVAICHFFVEQKTSLISLERRDDPTLNLLYSVAKKIFGNDIQNHEEMLIILERVCAQMEHQFRKAKSSLLDDVKDAGSLKRTAQHLDDGILYLNEICKRHNLNKTSSSSAPAASSSSSSTSAPTSPSAPTPPPASASSPSSSTISQHIDVLPVIEPVNKNWIFIDEFKNQYNKIDWKKCFNIGKRIGLFASYRSPSSLKAAYYRSKS
ncbi:hypothetical protein DM01DRAFT_1334435 [Hesseltinella vesiculosa]|uniref:Uncharacterized protein n=1 Tax=Hesseltinella vesiculosa TaxID=101127 RepID=A0A1X2GLT7_9FUNG|nr:hypothetical protein DM01DRAFT_1334435 [Hesseltinella vesiculosa]